MGISAMNRVIDELVQLQACTNYLRRPIYRQIQVQFPSQDRSKSFLTGLKCKARYDTYYTYRCALVADCKNTEDSQQKKTYSH